MENNEKKLKRKEFKLTDDKGNLIGDLSIVSIVTDPAIEMSYQLFSGQKVQKTQKFKITSEEKMEITGPVMIPDKDILRFDEKQNEYFYCWFSKDTVRKCMETYMENCNHIRANFEHSTGPINGIFASESWIVTNPEIDKSKALGFVNIIEGTWFITYKVKDRKMWEEIKKSDFTGFSIEGNFAFSRIQQFSKEQIDEMEKILDSTQNTNVKGKYTLLYNLLKDIVHHESMEDEHKYRLIRKILSRI